MTDRQTVTVEPDSRYGWLGGERCDDCGKRYRMPWYAPNDVWRAVMKDEGGMLCPECFDRLAACRRFNLYWSCAVDNFPGDLPDALGKQMEETRMARDALFAMQTERDAERERAGQVWTVADELLKLLEGGEPGHPGEYARRTGWIQERLVKQYRERLENLHSRYPQEKGEE